MNKQLLAVAFAFLAFGFSVPAFAGTTHTFTGVCTLTGTATLMPGIVAVPAGPNNKFHFETNNNLQGGAANLCTGRLDGVQVTNVRGDAKADGMGTLGCSVSLAMNGTGTLTIGGTDIGFKNLVIVGTGPQVTFKLEGNTSGNAAGQASFTVDTGAAGKCVAGATSLEFVIGASAAELTETIP